MIGAPGARRIATGHDGAFGPNRALSLLLCPTCRESVFMVSFDGEGEPYIECATCPPAPAMKLTREAIDAARFGIGQRR